MEGTVDIHQRFNCNEKFDTDEVFRFHLTDFMLTSVDGVMVPLVLDSTGHSQKKFRLSGALIDPLNTANKLTYSAVVSSYVIDFGQNRPHDVTQGFWMTGDDPDKRYKLIYPAAAAYTDYAVGVLDLACDRGLLKYYLHNYESVQCLHWTDFSLTDDALGTSQTLILPAKSRSPFLLKGLIKLNANAYCEDGMDRLSEHGDYSHLRVQTYIHANYFVDFGRDALSNKDPEFWVEDSYCTWIRLMTPCHPSYLTDHTHTMNQTIKNVQGYNWSAEEDEIWRHVTKFRLTDLSGAPHHLEIPLGTQFILWGDLVPPPTSSRPVISIKLYVTQMAIDLGREQDDPNKGVWMGDIRGDWYMLVQPAAPEYVALAEGTFHRAAKFLALHDALVHQDPDEKICVFDDDSSMYSCRVKIRDIHRQAEPKFDLKFVAENWEFVKCHLESTFDLDKSTVFVNSVRKLQGTCAFRHFVDSVVVCLT
jgi:nitrogen regulatory protein PII-like uncharacterized protein